MTEPAAPARGLLEGLRVLDVSSVLMAPMATQILADQGADVVCVEGTSLSTNRVLGPGAHPELAGTALNLLRNKRSVRLDLGAAHGHRAFLRLAATADVVVTNLRPRSLQRLGLTFADVAAVQPQIVWCEAHGYATGDERADQPAYDDIVQAASGLPDLMLRVAPGSPPAYVPTVLADKVCALAIAEAVVAGVVRRALHGGPVQIEVAMVDVMRAWVLAEHGAGAVPSPAVADAGYPRVLSPFRRPYATTDGHVSVLPYGPREWRAAFGALGRPELATDERLSTHGSAVAHAPELYEVLADLLASRTTDEALALLEEAGVACAALATIDELIDGLDVVDHPVAGPYRHIPTGLRVDGDAVAPVPRRPAPTQGEHTEELLREVGVTGDDLRRCLDDAPPDAAT